MDFRAIGVHRISWGSARPPPPGSSTRSFKACYGGASTKVAVQTPPGRCVLSPGKCGDGSRTIALSMGASSPIIGEFVDFVNRLEMSAASSLRDDIADRDIFSLVDSRGTMVTTAFDDADWFGPDGVWEEPPMQGLYGSRAASVLLELSGAWISATRWGLKWRVLQVMRCSDVGVPIDTCMIPSDG